MSMENYAAEMPEKTLPQSKESPVSVCDIPGGSPVSGALLPAAAPVSSPPSLSAPVPPPATPDDIWTLVMAGGSAVGSAALPRGSDGTWRVEVGAAELANAMAADPQAAAGGAPTLRLGLRPTAAGAAHLAARGLRLEASALLVPIAGAPEGAAPFPPFAVGCLDPARNSAAAFSLSWPTLTAAAATGAAAPPHAVVIYIRAGPVGAISVLTNGHLDAQWLSSLLQSHRQGVSPVSSISFTAAATPPTSFAPHSPPTLGSFQGDSYSTPPRRQQTHPQFLQPMVFDPTGCGGGGGGGGGGRGRRNRRNKGQQQQQHHHHHQQQQQQQWGSYQKQ